MRRRQTSLDNEFDKKYARLKNSINGIKLGISVSSKKDEKRFDLNAYIPVDLFTLEKKIFLAMMIFCGGAIIGIILAGVDVQAEAYSVIDNFCDKFKNAVCDICEFIFAK